MPKDYVTHTLWHWGTDFANCSRFTSLFICFYVDWERLFLLKRMSPPISYRLFSMAFTVSKKIVLQYTTDKLWKWMILIMLFLLNVLDNRLCVRDRSYDIVRNCLMSKKEVSTSSSGWRKWSISRWRSRIESNEPNEQYRCTKSQSSKPKRWIESLSI